VVNVNHITFDTPRTTFFDHFVSNEAFREVFDSFFERSGGCYGETFELGDAPHRQLFSRNL
jgi:hypothetical protein